MFSESFLRDFFSLRSQPPRTKFSEWARNPRTEAMFERDNNQMVLIRKYRKALENIANSTCCGLCQEAALVAKDALKENPWPPLSR